MHEPKDKEKKSRQFWEPAGVISQTSSEGGQMDYGTRAQGIKEGGELSLEVEEIFHNRGIMENLTDSQERENTV